MKKTIPEKVRGQIAQLSEQNWQRLQEGQDEKRSSLSQNPENPV
jgi:hypothetical protein